MNFLANVYGSRTSGRVPCSSKSILKIIPKFFWSFFLEKVFHCNSFSLFCQNFQCVCISSQDIMETNHVLKISSSHLGKYILRNANTETDGVYCCS